MQITILFHLIMGYVHITIEGYSIEKFINLAKSKGIFLWDLTREKNTILRAKIGIRDFKKLRTVARKTKCGVKLEEKKGLPFLMRKYRKRKIFLYLFGFVCLAILILSRFIWNIQIEGTEKINQDEILSFAKEYGINQGSLKSKIDKDGFINQIRIKRDDIAWIGIEEAGTNLLIKIVEAEEKPEIIDPNEYCQIVAKKDGAIQRIEAQNGTICVELGDIVKKGDILILRYNGRKIYRNKKCTCNRRSLGKSLV